MKLSYWLLLPLMALAGGALAQSDQTAISGQWPSFRGPYACGIADGAPTPIHWDAKSGENIQWKTRIPGLAHSSPIVWDDHTYLTSAESAAEDPELKVGLYGNIASADEETPHTWVVYAIDKHTGEIIWRQNAHTGIPRTKRHPKSSQANSTPATDGTHVVAFFGSEGLYCYSTGGFLLWKKDLGVLDAGFFRVPNAQWGFASSPIIHQGRVIIQCDVQKNSFLAAFDIDTGKKLWRTPREDVPTWSTPNIYQWNGQTRIAINGYEHIGGYDFATGAEVWELEGGGDIPVPTPVVANGLLYITNAHGKQAPIYAVKASAKGDVSLDENENTNGSLVWSVLRGGGYMQTPLVYGEYLYNCRDNGLLSCYNATTGEQLYEEKLGKPGMGFSASPVAANGKLYYTSEVGVIFVVQAGPKFELIAENNMDGICMATPAISDGTLFVRSQHYLTAIGRPKK